MFHILREELDEAFRADGRLRWKLLAAALVGLVVGIKLTGKFWLSTEEAEHGGTPLASICITGATILVSVVAVLLLSLKDVTKRRVEDGQAVNLLLRCYLCSGVLSLVLWMLTVIVVVLVATVGWAWGLE
jgi:hypothetical protein